MNITGIAPKLMISSFWKQKTTSSTAVPALLHVHHNAEPRPWTSQHHCRPIKFESAGFSMPGKWRYRKMTCPE
jgi:hypothetical protein